MWRGKLRWIFRGCGRAVKFPPMLWNMSRELYNRNAISSRDDLYSHRSTSGSSSRRRSKFVGKFFINLPPQRAIDKLYRLYKRSKSKRLVKRKDVLLSRPSFQLLTHSSPQTSPILKVR